MSYFVVHIAHPYKAVAIAVGIQSKNAPFRHEINDE